MPWYLFQPEDKPPYSPPDASGEGDLRFPLSILLLLGAGGCLVAAIVAMLYRAPSVSLWSVAAAFGCLAVAWLIVPKPKR